MKKKLFGLLLAGALIASQCVTAFAAGSKEAGELPSKVTKGYAVAEIPDASEYVADYISKKVSDSDKEVVASQIEQLQSSEKPSLTKIVGGNLAKDSDKNILEKASALSGLFDLKATDSDGDGTVKFSGFKVTKGHDVYALHLTRNGVWEIIKGKVNSDGTITVKFNSLSPVMLFTRPVSSGGSGGSSHSSSSSSGSSSSGGGSAAVATTATGLIASPKTGMVSDWTLWMGMAVVLLGISGAAFRRTKA